MPPLACYWLYLILCGVSCVDAEALVTVGFVVRKVAFEPNNFRISFESQNVCCDAIQKPTVVVMTTAQPGIPVMHLLTLEAYRHQDRL